MPVTFGDARVPPWREHPVPGDTLLVMWDTVDEVHIYGKKIWVPAVLISAPSLEEGELASSASQSSILFYPTGALRNIVGPHSGMRVYQNLDQIPWKWHAPSDSWEYACFCEMVALRSANAAA